MERFRRLPLGSSSGASKDAARGVKSREMRIPNFRRALLAVVLGNLIYALLMPHLPIELQHRGTQPDMGLFTDFLICAVLYISFGIILRHQQQHRDTMTRP